MLGADFALARFVAVSAHQSQPFTRTYATASLFVMLLGVGLVSLAMLAASSQFAQLFFGSTRYAATVRAFPVLLLGLGLHQISYNYLRGLSRFQRANLLLVANQAILPLTVAEVTRSSIRDLLVVVGMGWILISAVSLLFARFSVRDIGPRLREILRYGIPRAPGDFLQLGLFAAPALLIVHFADIGTAGLVALGTLALGMVGTVLSPLSFLLLPTAARMLVTNQVVELRREIKLISSVVVGVSLAITLVCEVFTEPLLRWYLGATFVGGTAALRVMLLGMLPFAIYITLKSVVDAHHMRAVNTINMAIAAATYLVGLLLVRLLTTSPTLLLVPFIASLYVLAGRTASEAARILGGKPGPGVATPTPVFDGTASPESVDWIDWPGENLDL